MNNFDKISDFELFLKAFGKNVNKIRLEKGYTQENMDSGEFPIDVKYFQRIEYGQRNITLRTLFKICKKLDISPKELFDFDS